jgi:hypothetical protein
MTTAAAVIPLVDDLWMDEQARDGIRHLLRSRTYTDHAYRQWAARYRRIIELQHGALETHARQAVDSERVAELKFYAKRRAVAVNITRRGLSAEHGVLVPIRLATQAVERHLV